MTEKCSCAETYPLARERGVYNPCNGVMRLYPSGNRACDCGKHVVAATRRGVK